jgi:hypothetical protein
MKTKLNATFRLVATEVSAAGRDTGTPQGIVQGLKQRLRDAENKVKDFKKGSPEEKRKLEEIQALKNKIRRSGG